MDRTAEEKRALEADLDRLMQDHNLDGVVFFGLKDAGQRLGVAFVTRLKDNLVLDNPDETVKSILEHAIDVYDDEPPRRRPIAQA